MSIERIFEILGGKRVGQGYLCHCPVHDDQTGSLSVNESEGKILFKCHANCSQEAVYTALKDRGLLEPKPCFNHSSKSDMAIETIAIYQDFNGNDIQKVIRKDNPGGKKSFSQWSLENESWIPKAPKGEVAPLFYREWKDKPNVILGEGEKVAQRLKELGLNATATPGGAGAWKKHYAKAFAGKVVSILPDNDEAGRKYASHAFRDIKEVAKSTRIVDLPGLKGKEDVVDWLDAGGTKEQLLAIIAEAFDVESHDVLASRERLKTKLICLNDVQSTQVEFLVEPYFPIGKVSLMSGDPGVGKSTFVAMLASAISAGRSISLAGSDNEKG